MTVETATPFFTREGAELYHGDCLSVLPTLPAESVDSVVTDPPYELGFMGKGWDKSGVAFNLATWTNVLRVLKPGGYMVAMGGTRTHHRLMCGIEDAGFEIRDCLMWLYGTGFPKSKGCLKPGWEPILLVRKPGPKVLPLGIDGCRVPTGVPRPQRVRDAGRLTGNTFAGGLDGSLCGSRAVEDTTEGRYPANVLHDGTDEVEVAFAAFGEKASGIKQPGQGARMDGPTECRFAEGTTCYADTGTASRFFYCAKASRKERGDGNTHPTVKPLALMEWLVRLVTPAGGVVLDPFAGSATTGEAALKHGYRFVGIERDEGYAAIAKDRLTGLSFHTGAI